MTMTELTLRDIRAKIDALAADIGRYTIVCARTGEHPMPIAGLRFPDRETATRAARAAQHYRAQLRQYDPRVAYHDLIICEGSARVRGPTHRPGADRDWQGRFWTVADRELARLRATCEDEQ